MVIVPTIIERNATSERVYDLYSCLLKERIIILTGEIDDAMSSSICAQLLYLSSISNDTIQMYINSPGGSVSAGLAIYDIMNYIKCDVSTICMGICASMAALLLCAGSKGKRCALSNSEIMIHQPLGGMQGQAKDMEIATQHMLQVKIRIYAILSKQTQQAKETIIKDCDRDHYMNANEAKKYGLLDTII
ncbi:MAG: ATP-dependent Clp protease proteolytic subunit [Longicatena sp.]